MNVPFVLLFPFPAGESVRSASFPRAGRILGARQSREPRPDGRKRAQEAARTEQSPARKAAGVQVGSQALLSHQIHVREAIGSPLRERGVLDILAEHTRALFVPATKQISASTVL
jgi:hypothetical protein